MITKCLYDNGSIFYDVVSFYLGIVELFGLGIESTAVRLYYNNHAVIRDTAEINEALLTVLKEGIQYG